MIVLTTVIRSLGLTLAIQYCDPLTILKVILKEFICMKFVCMKYVCVKYVQVYQQKSYLKF